MKDRAATSRHGIDRHHRGAHPHPGDRGFERPLEATVIKRDVGRGAAHVEADDAIQTGHGSRARGADNATGGAGQDRVLALEAAGLGQSAVGLHEIKPCAGQFRRHLIDVAPENRGQIGVHHRGVAAWHQAQQWADSMAGGDLGEARRARQLGQALLVRGIFPCMHQDDRAGLDAGSSRLGHNGAGAVFVQRLDLGAIHAYAAADFGNPLVQHRGQGDRQVEQARAGLVADAEGVGETAVDEEERAVALALQQRVGGDSRAHLDGLDLPGWDRLLRRQAED